MAMPSKDDWTIVLRPVNDGSRMIPCVRLAVTVGQKLIVSWKADGLYTNRYFLRTETAILDNTAQYKLYTPAVYGLSGNITCEVTQAGNLVIAGYNIGLLNSGSLLGDYVKVKIEKPET